MAKGNAGPNVTCERKRKINQDLQNNRCITSLPIPYGGAATALGRVEVRHHPFISAFLATISTPAVSSRPSPALRSRSDSSRIIFEHLVAPTLGTSSALHASQNNSKRHRMLGADGQLCGKENEEY
jgi:hypothetical protein